MIKKIYLDVDDEITSVIDKLKTASEEEVSLVFPKESGLLQSIVNLKLIKREAEKTGKNISVITANKIGRNLAEQIGLVASDHIETRKEPSPKELKTGGEKVLIEYKEEPEKPETDDKDVVFKKETLDDEDLKVKEDEEIGTLKENKNVEKSADIKSQAEDSKDGDKKFKIAFPLKGFGGVAAASVVGLLIFGYFYLPMVEAVIAVAAEKREFKTSITVDSSTKEDGLGKGIIAGEKIEFEEEESKKFDATGKKDAGVKATGTIEVKNSYSTSTQTLVSGTRFQTGSLIFKTTAPVDVPGYTDAGGGPVAGSANISVEAESPGASYNIGPSSFTIPAFAGTDKYSKVTGENTAAMSGGTTKEVSVVTTADINNAKNDFSKEIVDAAKKEAKDKVKKDHTLKDEALKVEIVSNTSSSGAGDETDQFTITINVKAQGISYSEENLKKAYAKKAENEGGGIKNVVDDGYDKSKATVSALEMEKGSFDIDFVSDIYLSSILDSNMIKDEIIGQTENKSKAFIMGQEGVTDVRFKFWPSFLKRIPRVRSHIKIKAEVSKVEKDDPAWETDQSG